MIRSTNHWLVVLCLLVCAVGVITATPSYADADADAAAAKAKCEERTICGGAKPCPAKVVNKFEIGQCASQYTGANYEDYEITRKLVDCIEGTIHGVTLDMMTVISNQFGWVVGVLATLVLIFLGVRAATGERDIAKRTAFLVVKLTFVVGFMNMLPDVVEAVFGILRDMSRLVTGGFSPWQRIDIFLGKLFGAGPAGAGPNLVLFNGILGLIGAVIYSSKVGLAMFFFAIMGVLNLLLFILAVIYTYCLSFLMIGFLLVFSPIMIPLSLFFYTERYFKKWVDLIVSAIITPVLIFAFMWMFVGIFDILIQNIFDILGGNDFRAYWRLNSSLCSWLMPSDPNTNVMMKKIHSAGDFPCGDRTVKPPVQLNINPLMKDTFDTCFSKVATLDFGADDVNIMQRLGFAFVTLWIFSSLMKSMVGLLPEVAASIASVSVKLSFGANSEVVSRLQGALDKTQNKLKEGAADDISKNMTKYATAVGKLVATRKK